MEIPDKYLGLLDTLIYDKRSDTKEEMYEHFKNGLVENPLWGMTVYATVRVFSEKRNTLIR